MSKLYPPIVEETLPAFYSENGVVKFTIPFSMNLAVSYSQIGGFELKIKTIQSGTVLYTAQTYQPQNYNLNKSNSSVTFTIEDNNNKLKIGQFYKVQLAYIDTNQQVGYYSGAAIIKYTTKPKLYINNLKANFLNSYSNSYTGSYEQVSSQENGQKDSTEKVYQYKFDIYDSTASNIFYSTGYKLHDVSSDTNIDYSQDTFIFNKDIEYNKAYYIQYSVITINGLVLSTPKYKLIHRELIDVQLDANIDLTLNTENGYIDITLLGSKNELGLYQLFTGSFLLLRADEDSEYSDWIELTRFRLNNEAPPKTPIFRDYTFEQGKKYQYAIQQYSDNDLYSNKIYSKIIQGDLEHAFLFDGKKQLKIKYNSKVAKFLNNRLEQKIDTIGGKYPFIFRNNQVNYHEFSVAGLISYLSDDEFLFISEKELDIEPRTYRYSTGNARVKNPQLSDFDNTFTRERIFKIKVLEWLNNGEPKIFRSPAEGNFIVRLMKISLSPEDKLGRMLHNFSGTAYEIAEYNYENLCKYNFIETNNYKYESLNFTTVDLSDPGISSGMEINKNGYTLQNIRFDNMPVGEIIQITFINNLVETIMIGATKSYFINNNLPIKSVMIVPRYEKVMVFNEEEFYSNLYYIKKKNDDKFYPACSQPNQVINYQETYYQIVNTKLSGLVTYSFYINQSSTFGLIENVTMDNCTIKQFIGKTDILSEVMTVEYNDGKIIQRIPNSKKKIIDYYDLKVRPRPIEYCESLVKDNFNIYEIKLKGDSTIDLSRAHPFTLYSQIQEEGELTEQYIGQNKGMIVENYDSYEPIIIINGEKIYITHETHFDLSIYDIIESLELGSGVVAELVYQTKEILYTIESTNEEIIELKEAWLKASTYNEYKKTYSNFIYKLNEELKKEGVL